MGAVPVLLAGSEEDAVAWTDDLDGAAASLADADALEDDGKDLGPSVCVPWGAVGLPLRLPPPRIGSHPELFLSAS